MGIACPPTIHRHSQEEAFWSRVDKTGDCWVWTGRTHQGYGYADLGGKHLRAHKYAFELLVGPVPEGLELDHLCRNRGCVNPAHLEPVTHAENVRRGQSPVARNAAVTHCPSGHAYSPENTRYSNKGQRHCRTCQRLQVEPDGYRRYGPTRSVCGSCGRQIRNLPAHIRWNHRSEDAA